MKAIDRKLLRDLRHLRGQLVAVAAVVACGIAALVAMRNNYYSLLESRDRYYDRERFADVFVRLVRAPRNVATLIEQVPGIAAVDARVNVSVTLDVPGLDEPATATLLSLPSPDGLNRVHLRLGRRPDLLSRDEVVVNEAFFFANSLSLGDTLGAVLNGRWQPLRVVGVGLSPEFIYALGGSSLFPDDRRFGVLWMPHEPLAAAFDLTGAFNDLSIALSPHADSRAVIARVDALLDPFGALGAHDRERQVSNRFVSDEIDQTRASSTFIPSIFLAIAAFLTHLVINRLVALQRDQIAVLKAFGYTNRDVGWHFVKMAMVAVTIGAIVGAAFGWWAGRGLAVYYTNFFHFPRLEYVAPPSVLVGAIAASAAAAALGALSAARRAARLPPAEAMRPEPPARFRATVFERMGFQRALPPAVRIIIRNLERRPLQTALTVFGIGMAVAILVTGYFFIDAVTALTDLQFRTVQRDDVTVTFDGPRSDRARYELASIDGVLRVEPFRATSVRLVSGHRERHVALLGLDPEVKLRQLLDDRGERLPIAPGGLVLNTALAGILDVRRGDSLLVEVIEGSRPVRRVPVVQLVDELIGTTAYMQREALDRMLGGERQISGAWLSVDEAKAGGVYRALKEIPAVGGVTIREATLRSFEETIAANLTASTMVLIGFAAIIAVGIVYNSARIALSERGRELASLRVLGFTRHEVGAMLLGEQALLTLIALPIGALLGYGLASLAIQGAQTEMFRIPLVVSMRTYILSGLWVSGAAVVSGLLVWRRVHRLDLIAVLKSRE